MDNKELAELTIDVLEALKELGPGLMIGAAAEYGIKALKVQEPIMRSSRKASNGFSLVWTCGICGMDLQPNNRAAKYCYNCGQAVKWDG